MITRPVGDQWVIEQGWETYSIKKRIIAGNPPDLGKEMTFKFIRYLEPHVDTTRRELSHVLLRLKTRSRMNG